ncbi:MAG: DUF1592 domain-containing protein [Pedosphaera sp.]|nr:DUF1592 domain-containing protein [Pedosphaera sp.]
MGDVQFIEDSGLERYLEAARTVAAYAVIGTGPLFFHSDRGRTGMELSAMERIQNIYRAYGFRTAAGEGAEPYGLSHNPDAFFTAWRFLHRAALGIGTVGLERLAEEDGVPPRFAKHVCGVLHQSDPPFPTSRFVDAWRALPTPASSDSAADVRQRCQRIYEELDTWQTALAMPLGNNEEAPMMTGDSVHITQRVQMRMTWPIEAGKTNATIDIQLDTVLGGVQGQIYVVFQDLLDLVMPDTAARLAFGRHPRGESISSKSLVLHGTEPVEIVLKVPPGATNMSIRLNVELDTRHSDERVVRCRAAVRGTPARLARIALLAPEKSPLLTATKGQLVSFARELPQVSHREPAPSDRDLIPAPYDNTYESPDRNYFHYKVKYHRDDQFLVESILDDQARRALDIAWADLLGSFDYHDLNLQFLKRKFGVSGNPGPAADLTPELITRFPSTVRARVEALLAERKAVVAGFDSAEAEHIEDVIALAARAWRRTVDDEEKARLRRFYGTLRSQSDSPLDHASAVRALVARVLPTPAFLYRVEPQDSRSEDGSGIAALSDEALASRLSFFLWASIPDADLRRSARAGELRTESGMSAQARRMLRDPKARRLATEFFGQWYGFYRFETHDGVDRSRFPEFTESLRRSLYGEAVAFFEDIVSQDRTVDEILFSPSAFLNAELAKHYGITAREPLGPEIIRVALGEIDKRGGLLHLGAILTLTSPPLRTSPVKRGDWVLRRILGTPPPPPNTGSIAADDVADDGLSVRARLARHSRQASCAHCHSRFDPLGFALEHYDPIGRWRATYRGGGPIEDEGTLLDGTEIRGFPGMLDHLRRQRPLFHRTLSAKLLGYALGRHELLSDRPLIAAMVDDCAAGRGFSQLVQRIVSSRQFRYQHVTLDTNGASERTK